MNFFVRNKNFGVTFVELLIVIVIIGSLLKLARSEARARASFVTISRQEPGDWSDQISVYENFDYTDGEVLDLDDDEEIKISTSSRNLVADASFDTQFITFNPRGWVVNAFTLALCSSATDKTSGRLITVNRVGKITEEPIDDDSCTQ